MVTTTTRRGKLSQFVKVKEKNIKEKSITIPGKAKDWNNSNALLARRTTLTSNGKSEVLIPY